MTNWSAIGAEGSAGPEGGREAPALGGGSGAARQEAGQVCAISKCDAGIFAKAALAAILLTLNVPSHVEAQLLPTPPLELLLNACSLEAGRESRAESLLASGWKVIETPEQTQRAAEKLALIQVIRASAIEREAPLSQEQADDAHKRGVSLATPGKHPRFRPVLFALGEDLRSVAMVRDVFAGDDLFSRDCAFAGRWEDSKGYVQNTFATAPVYDDPHSITVEVLEVPNGTTNPYSAGSLHILTSLPDVELPDAALTSNLLLELTTFENREVTP